MISTISSTTPLTIMISSNVIHDLPCCRNVLRRARVASWPDETWGLYREKRESRDGVTIVTSKRRKSA
jgi:hypothetical protein